MHFCFILVIFAFWGVHGNHFSCHFLFHSSAKHTKMSHASLSSHVYVVEPLNEKKRPLLLPCSKENVDCILRNR